MERSEGLSIEDFQVHEKEMLIRSQITTWRGEILQDNIPNVCLITKRGDPEHWAHEITRDCVEGGPSESTKFEILKF